MLEKKQAVVSEQTLARQQEFAQKAKALLATRYDHPPMAHVHSFGCPFVPV